jgi:hypothetical protein
MEKSYTKASLFIAILDITLKQIQSERRAAVF